ncbi:MAG: ABC transporter permease, partial [Mycobacteriaceae bacterium]
MSTTLSTTRDERRVPPLGGFNLTFLGMELRRMLRNRRTLIFALILPPVFFLLFGTQGDFKTNYAYPHGNITGYVMVSMAVYGAILSTTSGGAMVSVERALGWSRQLRLTPLKPVAYIVVKMFNAMLLGLVSIIVVFVVGGFAGADVSPQVWIFSGLIAWLASVVFAAFGLFMGYLL